MAEAHIFLLHPGEGIVDVLHRNEFYLGADAVLGGEVEVPTLTGKVMLKIPPLTQNGRVFKLGGLGMPRLSASGRGDLYAKVRVQLPQQLDDEQRRLFEELRAAGA